MQIAIEQKKSFFWGMTMGFLLTCFLLIIIGYFSVTQGVKVQLNAEQLATTVSKQVEEQAKIQLPGYIEEAKNKLPKEMAKQATSEFARTSIEFFNVQFNLPKPALSGIEKQLEITFAKSLNESFRDLNPQTIAAAIGKESYNLTKSSLKKQFNGKTVIIKPYKWLKVPVIIEIN